MRTAPVDPRSSPYLFNLARIGKGPQSGPYGIMPNYRRRFVPGGSYFFTVKTAGNAPLFADEAARSRLGTLFREAQRRWPFEMPAVILLPDHLHAIWTLPSGDDRYPARWGWIKKEFTKAYLAAGGAERRRSASRRRAGRRGVWQRRYWEHTLRDEVDFERHADYIHWNPVKHGHAVKPWDWEPSSFRRWVAAGHYEPDWGRSRTPDFADLEETVGE